MNPLVGLTFKAMFWIAVLYSLGCAAVSYTHLTLPTICSV